MTAVLLSNVMLFLQWLCVFADNLVLWDQDYMNMGGWGGLPGIIFRVLAHCQQVSVGEANEIKEMGIL